MDEHESAGYLKASLEHLSKQVESLVTAQAATSASIDTLRDEVRLYTNSFKALRWLGAVVLGAWMLAKTGDAALLKSTIGVVP